MKTAHKFNAPVSPEAWRAKWEREMDRDMDDAERAAGAGWCERAISDYGSAVGAGVELARIPGGIGEGRLRRYWHLPAVIAAGCRKSR